MAKKTIEVPRAVYAAIRALLGRVGVDHEDGAVIDMTGIAVTSRGGPSSGDISVSTLVSSQTREGRVEFALNGELVQMDLPKAREVVGMLQEAIEAAASDQMLFAFLTDKIGLDVEQAGRALLDFRELRQGSRGLVHPH